MKAVLSQPLSSNVLAVTRLIAVATLFLVTGTMTISSHAQSLPQAQEQNSSPSVPDARDIPAQTLFAQAVSLERESPEKAIVKYDELMLRFGRAATPGSRQFAARALLNKGIILGKQGNDRDAISTYERIERNFGNEKALGIREVLASALVSKAETFYKQGNTEKALTTYTQLGTQFNADDSDFIERLIDITKWRAIEIQVSGKTALSSAP